MLNLQPLSDHELARSKGKQAESQELMVKNDEHPFFPPPSPLMTPTPLLMGERQGRKLLGLFMILPQLAAQTAAATTEELKWMEQ